LASNPMIGLQLILVSILLAAQLRPGDPLVKIVATVTDARGRYVTDLGPEDFLVREDGVDQKIGLFSPPANKPLNIGILLDTSGSMQRKIVRASNAIEDFVADLHKDDDIFLMSFADQPRLI